jgi:hypothetical protein
LAALAQTPDSRSDAGLGAFLPGDTVLLAGLQMDTLRTTALYRQMTARQRFADLDDFAKRTGFDPRQDVRHLLVAWNGSESLVVARGAFRIAAPAGWRRAPYKGAVIFASEGAGFAVIDPTTAIAGTEAILHRAIDQKQSRQTAAGELLKRAAGMPAAAQVWLVAQGFAKLPAQLAPDTGNAANFTRILRSLENLRMWADVRSGIAAKISGSTRAEEDAKRLGDATRGFIGMGRLSVPEKQPELLRFWDGFKVEQRGAELDVDIRVTPDLLDAFVKFIETQPPPAPPPRPRKKK